MVESSKMCQLKRSVAHALPWCWSFKLIPEERGTMSTICEIPRPGQLNLFMCSSYVIGARLWGRAGREVLLSSLYFCWFILFISIVLCWVQRKVLSLLLLLFRVFLASLVKWGLQTGTAYSISGRTRDLSSVTKASGFDGLTALWIKPNKFFGFADWRIPWQVRSDHKPRSLAAPLTAFKT